MSQQRHAVGQAMVKLRREDKLLGKGAKVPEFCKQFEFTEQTDYRWRQKYGGLQAEMATDAISCRKRTLDGKRLPPSRH